MTIPVLDKWLTVFPAQTDRLTVLALTPTGHIRKISYWDSAHEPVTGYLQ